MNGSTGEVYNGKVETQAAELSGDFADLMKLSDKYTRLQVRTNADTPHDAEVARNFGAVGIGLCRCNYRKCWESPIKLKTSVSPVLRC